MSKYTSATIFTKKGNLLPFIQTSKLFDLASCANREAYARERDIQLVLSARYDRTPKGTRLMCKISCPINPLPVCGEFEVPSYGVICRWLQSQGWTKKETLHQRWFE